MGSIRAVEYFKDKKKGSPEKRYTEDEPEIIMLSEESDASNLILFDPVYMKYLEYANPQRHKAGPWLSGAG